jgi:glutamine synthetase
MPLKKHQKRTVVEYIWQDSKGEFRSKTKIFPTVCWEDTLETTPLWHFDGSSTGQADTSDSEVVLKPWFKCMDPFRYLINKGNTYSQLIFCDLWVPKKAENGDFVLKEGLNNTMDGLKNTVEEEVSNYGYPQDLAKREEHINSILKEVNGKQMELVPHRDNTREKARKLFERQDVNDADPWFGFEQEFFFIDLDTNIPVGFKYNEELNNYTVENEGKNYCGVGNSKILNRIRRVSDEVLNDVIIIKGHLNCSGYNLEVAPGQCEFQIRGSGLDAADNLTIFRYLLTRRALNHNLGVSFHPKPMTGKVNGSGCHANFSTKSMRSKNGIQNILSAVDLLKLAHNDHMEVYGEDNKLRMTGNCETSKFDEFSWGVGDRTASIRIPQNVMVEKCGYLEDRRPSANCDPYLVSSKMVETVVLNAKKDVDNVVSELVDKVIEEDHVEGDSNEGEKNDEVEDSDEVENSEDSDEVENSEDSDEVVKLEVKPKNSWNTWM